MNVLVINQYASAPKYSSGAGERHYFLAKEFNKRKIQTTILSAGYSHLFNRNPTFVKGEKHLKEKIDGVDFIWIKTKKYSALSGFGRVYSWFEFLAKLFFTKSFNTPNVVIVSSMSLLPALYAIYLKKTLKIPFILEIRDIWPLTFKELGNASKYHPLVLFLKFVETLAYRHADAIVSVLPGFDLYISKYYNRLHKPVLWIPNGISPELLVSKYPVEYESNKNNNTIFRIVYTGALGVANQMIFLLKAAELLKSYQDIEFHILGDGYEKPKLVDFKMENNLANVYFYEKIQKEKVNAFIENAHICYHGCKNSYLYTYGISPNKLNDYMLASRPILSASGLKNDPVNIAKCGLVVASENAQAIADGILKLKSLPSNELSIMGQKGYDFLMANQTYSVLSEKYLKLYSELNIIN